MNTENDECLDILLAANAGLIPELAPAPAVRKRMLANIHAACNVAHDACSA